MSGTGRKWQPGLRKRSGRTSVSGSATAGRRKKGDITIQIPEGEETKGLEGVQFTVTRVGTLKDGSYELLPEYASAGVNLNELKNADEMEASAEKLEETWKEQKKEETGKRRMLPEN